MLTQLQDSQRAYCSPSFSLTYPGCKLTKGDNGLFNYVISTLCKSPFFICSCSYSKISQTEFLGDNRNSFLPVLETRKARITVRADLLFGSLSGA